MAEPTHNRTVLVLLDPAGEVRSSVLELLTIGRTLGRVEAVTLEAPSVEALAQLGAYGVETVHQAELPADLRGDSRHLSAVVAAVLAAAVRLTDADVVLAPATFGAKEAVALAGRELGAGVIIDAAGVSEDDQGHIVGTKRVFAGSWDTASRVTTDVAALTVRANAVVPQPAETAVATEVEGFVVNVAGNLPTVTSRTETVRDTDRPTLEEAAIVVAGGRGTDGDFGPVHEFADAVGAAVGATRDAVFEGWYDRYIGQTGVTVAPRLYVGAGISGAPHHRGGMQASQVIVAVNNDPEAPIFEICDFAVVGELSDVLTQAAEVIREHKAAR
ncbi:MULTISPECIES: electron transfer flavoprotein subunit alpha/FixB family protein [unclassified Isoptericola]|uniref:electron transfer flavoprotein subunit alpha/FixB family protein n=1 Tax=unclassified Isoptericola TaxID=2623355 RepID=UPI002713AA75|nr:MULTISPECIES: electron transfer flavoprotein subunit alpha/FixB family protein [unclassified Isoptericola]MDO8142997.1 electron transfer flavoprotein subunit alpha/FixB family protein [Isoptericola sp. 178]MDO8146858.1 electron transfer flavoprotein subunit alpha/FixB family protein [Isoptericola sp. b515]MDO8150827.1 electron transfer flavoprotein subunit alpha/FixB family protein [Isoptericola sp. b408]